MVLNKISHLARSSFGKTLTHVPQTVVAGTQSSYASTGTPFAFNNHAAAKFGKGNAHLHTSFQSPSSPASAKSKAAPGSSNGNEKGDSGLTAYYDAWQKQHQPGAEEKEWKQFQFTKRIGWKAPTAAVLAGRAKEIEDQGLRPEARIDAGLLNRALTESAVQDLRQSGNANAEAEALARVNEAIAAEITQIKESAAFKETQGVDPQIPFVSKPAVSREASPADVRTPTLSTTSITSPVRSGHSSVIGDLTASTSQEGFDQDAYSEHVAKLSDEQRYAEIPPVFEAMLHNGIRPTIKAYNGLLSAVIHLPIGPHQVVPRALNVYTDLLRRKVVPDIAFYSMLIGLLSNRALETLALKKALQQQRGRFGDKERRFLFASESTEFDIVSEDDSVVNAIRIFDSSTSAGLDRLYPSELYRSLITACARYGKVDEMIRVLSHMDTNGIPAYASIYPPMIDAFAAHGDLASVVECYNGYKALAILHNHGMLAIRERNDLGVYAAVVRAYAKCGRLADGLNFWTKIRSSYEGIVDHKQQAQDALQDSIVVDAVLPDLIDRGELVQALKTADEVSLTPYARDEALLRVCVAAADATNIQTNPKQNDIDIATVASKAYNGILGTSNAKYTAAIPMLALHVRQGEIDLARQDWSRLLNAPQLDSSFAEATAFYARMLSDKGCVDDALVYSREAFGRIRSAAVRANKVHEAVEKIDEAIEYIGSHIARTAVIPSPQASMTFLRAMIENRGLVSPITEQLMAGLGSQDILGLSLDDLHLALQVESDIVNQGNSNYDVAHVERFAHLMETVIATTLPPPRNIFETVESATQKVSSQRPGLFVQWQNFLRSVSQSEFVLTPLIPYVFSQRPEVVEANVH